MTWAILSRALLLIGVWVSLSSCGRDEVETAKIESLCYGWGAGNMAEIAVRRKYFSATGLEKPGYAEKDFVQEIQKTAREANFEVPEKLVARIWRESPSASSIDDLRPGSRLITHAMTIGRAACRDYYGLKVDKDLRR